MKKARKESDLICGLNWLGDSIMSMPALQLHRQAHPDRHLALLVKPPLIPLWQTHPAIDEVIALPPGGGSIFALAGFLRSRDFARALILPNSFRSALVPFLARIPERVGMPGHQRAWMLSRVVNPPADAAHAHQVWEYVRILGLPGREALPAPRCRPPQTLVTQVLTRLRIDPDTRFLAVFPGAARGPAKQWPPQHFAEAVRRFLDAQPEARPLLLGASAEEALCARLAADIGPRARSLAGLLNVPESLAVLSGCPVALSNDSGGMHLASASGCRVVAVFGLTDADKTGPLGEGHRLIRARGVKVSRDVPRRSPEAAAALNSIRPETVAEALCEAWKEAQS